MIACKEWVNALEQGKYDDVLAPLYAPDGLVDGLDQVRSRTAKVVNGFCDAFAPAEREGAALFSAPGRTEIGGNHTDHQHGHVLCGSVDLDMLACAAPNLERVIRIRPEGYSDVKVDLEILSPIDSEVNTSAALVRGVAARMIELGYPVHGFDAYVASDVLVGSGMSSSAAFEVLIGNMINHFFCGGALDAVEIAKIGQYAENVYFGKPCGLMDQIASSVGGVVSIDFTDPAAPIVRKVDYDFTRSGHALCIVDTGSCHADLTNDYADITREMGAAANFFGKNVLRDVPEAEFRASLPALRNKCGDRAVLRAMHFYEDDRRAVEEAAALERGDFEDFLALCNTSGISSALHLQNTWSTSDPKQQAIPLALAVGKALLDGAGAIRVHGGGFAGTIQAFVPDELLSEFKSGMERLLGAGACHVLRIRPQGGCVVME